MPARQFTGRAAQIAQLHRSTRAIPRCLNRPLHVMRGLDPRIHHIRKTLAKGWIAGSSPAMSTERSIYVETALVATREGARAEKVVEAHLEFLDAAIPAYERIARKEGRAHRHHK